MAYKKYFHIEKEEPLAAYMIKQLEPLGLDEIAVYFSNFVVKNKLTIHEAEAVLEYLRYTLKDHVSNGLK